MQDYEENLPNAEAEEVDNIQCAVEEDRAEGHTAGKHVLCRGGAVHQRQQDLRHQALQLLYVYQN